MASRIFLIALLASLSLNLALIYRVFDMGLSDTSRTDEIERRERQVRESEKLMPQLLSATSRANLQAAAQSAGLEVLDKGDEGIYVGGIQFEFSKGRIIAVRFD